MPDLDTLPIEPRYKRALRAAGFTTTEQLSKVGPWSLLSRAGIGQKCVRYVSRALAEVGTPMLDDGYPDRLPTEAPHG